MNSIEGLKCVNRIHKRLLDTEKIDKKLVEDLKELRKFAVEEKDPVLVKLIRLTYEHIEEYEGFFITIPEDDILDENGKVIANPDKRDIHDDYNMQIESLEYLLSLLEDSKNKNNKEEILDYRSRLIKYADEN